jgi:hypothetical protein
MKFSEAKELSLEVWEYLAAHPSVRSKNALPLELLNKVRGFSYCCPLCAYAFERDKPCEECILSDCEGRETPYQIWRHANEKDANAAAQKIVARIKAWEAAE